MSNKKFSFYIETMGCQMNEYESDQAAISLILNGFKRVSAPQEAGVILVNTCTVRDKPDQKAYSLMGRLNSFKKKDEDIIIVFMGCLAQSEGNALLKRFPKMDIVVGTKHKDNIPELIKRVREKHERIAVTSMNDNGDDFIKESGCIPGYFNNRVSAFLSVMEGCNNFCTYCIVPYVRGREISRPVQHIVNEAENLIKDGVREIILLGQNVNSYCSKEGSRDVGFAGLLEKLNNLPDLFRIRFTTSHPKDLSSELISCFEKLERLCPHIHLPFQSGSDRILKLMGRFYTREHYINLIDKIRAARPDIAITADVMVGFPGETHEEYMQTIELIKYIAFDNLFSFKYSDREGTAASKMSGKLLEYEKNKRLSELQSIQQEITLKKNNQFAGRIVEVLVEGTGKRESQFTGRSDSNRIVNFISNVNPEIGHFVNVFIQKGNLNSLRGVSI